MDFRVGPIVSIVSREGTGSRKRSDEYILGMVLPPLTDITESAISQESGASSSRKIMFRREKIINSFKINIGNGEVNACHKKAPFIKIALLYTRETHLSRIFPAGDEGKF